ncbi:MAG: pyruvate dehydrogenase (acetyl-transferring) E1 component subunit alpha [Clostridiales bacterium GWC2_40_7]|nr:MAG: pyruvate dehydrogenase (acetyl-transferring) E1 component subunit alpha [Clostridiales bacterium GWC2_40_7]
MPDLEVKLKMLKDMMAIRRFEDVIKRLYKEGLVEGAIHCYTGEEAVAVGVCAALRKDDYIFSTHRGHGHAIAKGCDLKRVFAELMGRSTGLSGGMGGSMHLFDLENGLMGGNGIVGGGIPLSLGTAYSAKYRGTDQVTVCFFSEGASNQGTFHEAINMASLWKLPLIFICENNLFAATTPSYKTLSNPDVAARAAGYSLPGVIADGNDVLDVYEECNTAVERARKGEGPTLLECKTYRVEGHCMVLKDLPQHRPKQEVEEWAKKDPIDVFEQKMIMMGEISNKSRIEIDQKINREFEEAIAFAKSSPFPDVQEFKEKVL